MWGVDYGYHKAVAASSERRFGRVWRVWAAFWAGLFLALVHVPSALAEGQYQPSLAGVVQGPTPYANYGDDDYYDGYLVYGSNKYNCLIYALGLNPNDFDLVARSKLSSPTKGGKFYEVVQQGYNDHCPAWVSVPFYEGWLYQSGTTPGSGQNPQYLWAFEIYKDDYEQAKEDAETIRDGGSIDDGGGGDGGDSGDAVGSGQDGDITAEVELFYTGNVGKFNNRDSITYKFSEQYLSELNSRKEELESTLGYDLYWAIALPSANSKIILLPVDFKYVFENDNLVSVTNTGDSRKSYYEIGLGNSSLNSEGAVNCNRIYSTNTRTLNAGASNSATDIRYLSLTDGEGGGGSGGEDEPDEPSPDPWPEPENPTPKPTNPTVPDTPEPTTPTQPDPPNAPNPVTPVDPVIPDDVPPSVTPTIMTDNDFTVDLSGVLDALNEHCIHIQTCLNSNFTNTNQFIYDLVREFELFVYHCIYDNFGLHDENNKFLAQYIVENLLQGLYDGLVAVTSNQADMLDYFEDFAAWLDEKLDFQFPDSYDDTSVVYWLKRLYYKNGTGTVSRPEDPVVDPFGIGEWLRNLANLLIQALEGIAPGLVGDLLETIDLLKLKFPFSLPWDIMTILGAFVASPEAPSVDFPCYAYTASGLEQVGTYEIDLDAYSSVMEGVRFVGYLGFMAYTLSLMPKWAETMCEVVGC